MATDRGARKRTGPAAATATGESRTVELGLAAQLLAQLDPVPRLSSDEATALEQLLAERLHQARRAWPGIELAPAIFVAHLAASLSVDDDLATALAQTRTDELYLSCACGQGDAQALQALETNYFGDVEASIARMNLAGTSAADVMQIVRRDLLVVGPHGAPRILDYRGGGELRSWLRVTAVRAALKGVRKHRREIAVEDEELAAMPAPGDVELDFIKRQYRAAFKRAFLEALSSLEAREQNLVRQHFLDGLSIDQLGALYRIHRSTAARWLTRAQATLLERTKRTLTKRMKVSRSECESIIRMAQSQLHLTLRSLAPPR